MEERHYTISLMVVHSFMMRLLVLSGLRIKSLFNLVKLWWLKNALNNGYGNWLLLKFTIFLAIMIFSILNSSWKIASTSIKLFGVGAHIQNALAEWAIQTIIFMARTFMVHVSLHQSEYWADNLAHNHILNHLSGLKPLKLLTKTKANHLYWCLGMPSLCRWS